MLERVTVNPEAFMPRQPGMIQGNPFQRGFDAEETRTAQAEQRDAVRLERDNKDAFNTGLSGILADPSVANDPGKRSQAVAGLYSRTGQGKEALSTLGTEDSRRKDLENKALTAYANGQGALGDQYSAQAGVTIPDAIKNDGKIAAGLKMAHDMGYTTDPRQAATFAVKYKETGDPNAASAAAGLPYQKPQQTTPQHQLQTIIGDDGKPRVVRFNVHTGQIEDTGYQGYTSKGTGGGGGRGPLAFEVKQRAWLAIPGNENDLKGAALFAAGKVGMSRADALKSALTTVRALKNEFGEPFYQTEAEVMQAAERFANKIQGIEGNLSTVTPPASPPSVTTPGAAGDPSKMTDEQLLELLKPNGGTP